MKDDDETWMCVAPQDVEQMLNRYKFDEAKLAGDLYGRTNTRCFRQQRMVSRFRMPLQHLRCIVL